MRRIWGMASEKCSIRSNFSRSLRSRYLGWYRYWSRPAESYPMACTLAEGAPGDARILPGTRDLQGLDARQDPSFTHGLARVRVAVGKAPLLGAEAPDP